MTPLLLKTVITESAQLLIVVVALATIAVSSSSSDINSDILIYWSEKVKKRSLTWAATNELTNGHVRRFFMSVRWSLTHTVIVDICSPCLSCVQLRVPAHMRSYSSPTGHVFFQVFEFYVKNPCLSISFSLQLVILERQSDNDNRK